MNKLLTFIKLLFCKNKPCPYWNFFTRTCLADKNCPHNRGFENVEYCKHIDGITSCLHYKKIGENNGK